MSHKTTWYRMGLAAAWLVGGSLLGVAAEAAPTGAPAARPGMADGSAVTARPAMSNRLRDEMDTISARYRDAKQDLEDEYAKLVQERDDNRDAIFQRVKELKEERLAERTRYDRDVEAFRQRMADARVSSYDQRYLDENATLRERQRRESRLADASLENLQQLYQLNSKRYNELQRILNARESLEDSMYREERDYAAARVRFEEGMARDARDGLTPEQRDRQTLMRTQLDEQRDRMETRYQNSMDALDELRSLVENRLAAQRSYLEDHQALRQNIVNAGLTEQDAGRYSQQLAELEARRNNDERAYQANVRYLEEKLAVEQTGNRDLARLDQARMAVARRRVEEQSRLARERREIEQGLAAQDITVDQRNQLDQRRQALQSREERAQEAYNQALNSLARRREVLERAKDERLAYLRDRNAIRVRMASEAVNSDNFADFRTQIVELEDRRMADEKRLRDELMELDRTVPNTYRMSRLAVVMGNGPDDADDSPDRQQRRMDRLGRRLDRMQKNLESRWNRQQATFDERLQAINERLADANLSDSEKTRYQQLRDELQAKRQEREQQYRDAVQRFQERRRLEEVRVQKRVKYIKDREALLDNMNAQNVTYDDLSRYENDLRTLDSDWDAAERQYRESIKPLRSMLPDDDSQDWQETAKANWERTVRRAERQARADFDPAVEAERRTGVRGAFQRFGERIQDSYHNALNYLQD